MAVSKDKIQQLLGQGLSTEIVASAVGCEPSYVSQLMGDEEFAAKVTSMRAASLLANTRRDDKIGDIEEKLVDRLADLVDGGLIYKARDVLHAAAVVNRMQRRGAGAPQHLHMQQTVVQLNLPAVALSKFVTTPKGEVIEADGQTLVTMPAHQLLRKLHERSGGTNDLYQKAGRFIAGGDERDK